MDPILGQITFFAFNFEQMYWMRCMGQQMSIPQNSALYSLLGNSFGGSYPNTFALPDLRGKVILGQGAVNYDFGTSGGSATTTLSADNLPVHTHSAALTLTNATTTISVNASAGTTNTPSSRANCIGTLASDKGTMYNNVAPNVPLNVAGNTVAGSVAIAPTGNNTSFPNMPPYCVLNAAIAISGIYPSRD